MTNNYYKISFYIMCTMLSLLVLENTGYAEKDEKEKGSLVDKYFKDEKNLKEDEKIADCPFCRRTIKIDNEGNITKFKEDKYQVERFIAEALNGVPYWTRLEPV